MNFTPLRLGLTCLALGASPGAAQSAQPPVPDGFRDLFTQVNGQRLHAVVGGQGRPVVLVHGYAQTWYEWRDLMPQLARTHTVIALDLPGLGLSDGSRTGYDGRAIADQLYAAVRSITQAPFALVAHDIGIWNTYPLVAQHPADVTRVVFMEAPIPDESLYTFPAFTAQGAGLGWHFGFFTASNVPDTLIRGRTREWFDSFFRAHAARPAAFPAALVETYARAYDRPGSLQASLDYYRALNTSIAQNKTFARTKLPMPVLAIGGEASLGAFEGQQLQKYASNVTSVVLPDCGHWVPEECGPAVAAQVLPFLERP